MVWNGSTASIPLERTKAMLAKRACAFGARPGPPDFQRRAVFAECAGPLVKNLRSTNGKISGRSQPGGAKILVASFDDHNPQSGLHAFRFGFAGI